MPARPRLRTSLSVLAVAAAASVAPLAGSVAHASGYGPEVFYLQSTDLGQTIVRAPASNPTDTTTVFSPGANGQEIVAVQVSPLGSRLAVELYNGIDDRIVLMDRNGRNRHTLVDETFTDTGENQLFGFDWRPDAREIAIGVLHEDFSDFDDAKQRTAHVAPWALPHAGGVGVSLETVRAIGSPVVTKVPGGRGLASPAYSPDGTHIAAFHYDFSTQQGAAKLFVVDPASGTHSAALLSTSEAAVQPSFSPDGRHIAYSQETTDFSDESGAFTGDVREIAADGSDHGTSTLLASGGTTNDAESPAWSANSTVWFDSANFGSESSDGTPGDLFSVALPGAQGAATPVNLTHTTSLGEANPTFGAANDTGVPKAVVFHSFVLGTHATTVRWGNPLDPEFSHVQIRRDGQIVFTGAGTSFADFGTVVGKRYTYRIQSFNGDDVPGPSVTSHVVATSTPVVRAPNPTSNKLTTAKFPVNWAAPGAPKSTTYDVRWATWVVPAAPKGAKHPVPTRLLPPAHIGKEHRWFARTGRTHATFGAGHGTKVRPGETYLIQARDHDAHGNASEWSTVATATVPLDQTAAAKTGTWTTAHSRRAWLHTTARTTEDQAALTFHVTASAVRLLVEQCKTCGSFDVYTGTKFGGTYQGTFGTHSFHTKWRQQLFQLQWKGVGHHLVRIVAHLEPGQQLNVDGMVVVRQVTAPRHSGGGAAAVPFAAGAQPTRS